ncbi:hypothetical protein FRB99_007944 [Tulasnella sp. 403]|nr:hypothetical protein FRB99_007944 [Tulasnella sp. 403]
MNALFDAILQNVTEQLSQGVSVFGDMADDMDELDFELELEDDSLDVLEPSDKASAKREETDEERQLRVLDGYITSLPYPCESVEEMKRELDNIIGKLFIAVESRQWNHVLVWDRIFLSWISLKYPLPRSLRASLARVYYELIFVPAMDPSFVQVFASTLRLLIGNKPGSRRKLELHELTLPWEPLWEVMEPEVWHRKRAIVSSRNLQNVLLRVAEACSDYFPPSEIPKILDTFLPRFTQETATTVLPLLTAFLPVSHAHLYMPFMFKIWEAFHSYKIEDSILTALGALAVVHVAGKAGEFGPEGSLPWKDVGIFSDSEWAIIMRSCLASMNRARPSAFKRSSNRYAHLAQIIVYSMSVDGPVRDPSQESTMSKENSGQKGYLAGSKALDSLDRLITSVETFFHPSNYGAWTFALTAFVQRLATEFSTRWHDEQLPSCRTPVAQRLTPAIKRSVVEVLRTPVLLAMFSKDALTTTWAQSALKPLALMEPDLIMPQLLERAYGGLESINETHRTTAAIGALSAVTTPLTVRSIWLNGQRNLVPLLELCLPGIDINDAVKTVHTTVFILTALQHVKIGDLNMEGSVTLGHDAPGEDVKMNLEGSETPLSDREKKKAMSEEELEEDIVVRQSTAGFADWVVSFFRRIFALYENLPEEGGKSGKTGGKTEETVLKSINSALDVVCANLSDSLFRLVLNLTYDYCTTNARSNVVRSIGNLVNSMARTRPKETIAKFLPFCKRQIEIEIAAGASSVRTTSNTATPLPSDTTLHWNLAIIRAALGYGGRELLRHKDEILDVMNTLRKAKNERGYSSFGRMVNRILATLTGTYPMENRLVNPRQWNDPYFERSHHQSWGKQFNNPKDIEIVWHQASDGEIDFALEIFGQIVNPTLDSLNDLVRVPPEDRDAVWRNDFCRMVYLVRSAWSGAASLFQEPEKTDGSPCLDPEHYIPGLNPTYVRPKTGFALTTPQDPRYAKAVAYRQQFGQFLHTAFVALTQDTSLDRDSADAVDASIQLVRALDVYLLEYGISQEAFATQRRHFTITLDMIKAYPRQRSFPRSVWIKRAVLYHYTRMFQHVSWRERSALDDQLMFDLVELSLSPYTRLRKHAQGVLLTATALYRRARQLALPRVIEALELEIEKGKTADPDRQKGALHVLSDKNSAAFFCSIQPETYISAILRCQSQEKPSIQKLVGSIVQQFAASLTEESLASTSFTLPISPLSSALAAARQVSFPPPDEQKILKEARDTLNLHLERRSQRQQSLLKSLENTATSPNTHWRYKEYATRCILSALCRDEATTPPIVSLFVQNVNSEHPSMRSYANRGLAKALLHTKMRTFSKDRRQLWLRQWTNPLSVNVNVDDPEVHLRGLEEPLVFGRSDIVLVDKQQHGFLTWAKSIKGYRPPPRSSSPFVWEAASQPCLAAIKDAITKGWVDQFVTHLSQESSKALSASQVDIRLENILFVKALFKMFEATFLGPFLERIDGLLLEDNKYAQRASIEILTGILRGSKHWSGDEQEKLWQWVSARLPRLFDHIKPDTILMWDTFLGVQLGDRDPRRNQPLVDFINSQQIDFSGDSAFAISKRLATVGMMTDALGSRTESQIPRLMTMYFDNIQTPYAEIRAQIAASIGTLIGAEWHPRYRTASDVLLACTPENDALQLRKTKYMPQVQHYIDNFELWRSERLPPPRVSQSTYDRVGLTLLQWIWGTAHSVQAPSIFPYVMPLLPEIFKMAELNDSSELQLYSGAVLNVLSSIAPPQEFVEGIIDKLIDAVKTSPSWRIRLSVLPVLQVFYFRNLLNLSEGSVDQVMSVLLQCIRDENVEVRETAAKTLSGVIRCSQRQCILPLKNRFATLARRTKLPRRGDKEAFTIAIRTLHSAVLGLCALLDAYPYSVEPWAPEIIEILARYSSDPAPISTSIRKCAASFKQTHQDTWATDQLVFNEDQMQALATIVSGTSYYA